jgi:hypothetical protein
MHPIMDVETSQRDVQQKSILLQPRHTLETLFRRPGLVLNAIDDRGGSRQLKDEILDTWWRSASLERRDNRAVFAIRCPVIICFGRDKGHGSVATDDALDAMRVPAVKHCEPNAILFNGFVAVRAALGRHKVFLLGPTQRCLMRCFRLILIS